MPPTIVVSTKFSKATFTPEPTLTQTPTRTPRPSITPSPNYPPYPVKDVVFEYRYSGDFGIFDDLVNSHIPQIILYSDGQLIIDKGSLYEKMLSKEEVHSFLSQ